MIQEKKTICPLDCPDACGMIATIEGGSLKALRGDPDHPVTRGFLCKKMRDYHTHVESASRVLYPQIRVGKKGEGKFKRISWDEAWDLMVAKLSEVKGEYGGEALLPFSYAGNMGMIQRAAGYPFFHRYGASRLDPTICSTAGKAGWEKHCGDSAGSPMEQTRGSRLIIIWGSNTKVTNVHFWPYVNEAKREGAKVIVIDPYRNKTAKAADQFIQVKPGGDTALALALIKYNLETDRLNHNFIKESTTGFGELSAHLKTLSWDELTADSGISKEQIVELAELLSNESKCFLRIGVGLTRNTRGAMSVRAIVCLAATIGLFEQKQGQGVLLFSGAFKGDENKLNYNTLAKKKTRLINMVQLGHALTTLSPKVRALFVYSANPASVCPDASKVREGLLREDLFTIVHEQVQTATAKFADLLLPATTSLENSDILAGYGHFHLAYSSAAIPPKGECITNFELFQNLAIKMGYQDSPFKQTLDQRIDDYLSDIKGVPDEVDWGLFKKGNYLLSEKEELGKPRFDRSKPFKFSIGSADPDICPVPTILTSRDFHDHGLQSRYPFQLITPPNAELLNSTLGGQFKGKRGDVLIHPKDAESRNIKTGDKVKLYNHRGQTVRIAKVSDDTRQGLLVAEGLYWSDEEQQLTGINDLTSQNTTDLGGGSTFHESLVTIERE
ncbi:MAG: molybdopterin-dependent oxidoreductase [Proteobacteria bacterium]|nr:molybdopterin-dependent oxidoreductase [Pseudomonadota bacterium]